MEDITKRHLTRLSIDLPYTLSMIFVNFLYLHEEDESDISIDIRNDILNLVNYRGIEKCKRAKILLTKINNYVNGE